MRPPRPFIEPAAPGFERLTPNGPQLFKLPESPSTPEDTRSIVRYAAFAILRHFLDRVGEGHEVWIFGLRGIPRDVIDRIVREELA